MGPRTVGVFLRDPSPYLREFRNTTENSDRIGRQARPEIESGTSDSSFESITPRSLVRPIPSSEEDIIIKYEIFQGKKKINPFLN